MERADRIVITGMGVVSPLGVGLANFHRSLSQGESGISILHLAWETGYKTNRAGLVNDVEGDVELASSLTADGDGALGRTGQLASAACKMALGDAGFDRGGRQEVGIVVGTAMGEALEGERIWETRRQHRRADSLIGPERTSLAFACRSINDRVAAVLGLEGPSHSVATTCAAGNQALAWASDLLKSGAAKAMLAVGADTIGYVDMLGFSRLLLQAPDCCRPFDLHRKGTILSEGAGALLLEPFRLARRRGAEILAEVAGCGLSCDAAGPFASKVEDVQSLKIAAKKAFAEARCGPDEIQYVSAHGSGTRLNDAKETHFIKQLLGQRAYKTPVSSIKSMLGHAQGAASSLEAIASVLTFKYNLLYPTINYETPDPQCDLDYVPNQARECRIDAILSNAFGIGGNNALLILKRWTD